MQLRFLSWSVNGTMTEIMALHRIWWQKPLPDHIGGYVPRGIATVHRPEAVQEAVAASIVQERD